MTRSHLVCGLFCFIIIYRPRCYTSYLFMSSNECPDCGGTTLDSDPETSATFCVDCGRLISDNTLRSDNVDMTSTKNIVTPYGGGTKVRMGSVVNSNQSVRILDSYQDLVKVFIFIYYYQMD
jgi:hypothetical protein